MTGSLKTAYELLKLHDAILADRLYDNVKSAVANLQLATNRKRERIAKYDASWWQQFTHHEIDVLRPFNSAIEDMQTKYHAYADDLIHAAADIEKKYLVRKEAEIYAGNFVYYVVDDGTNNCKTMDNGDPIIYPTKELAEYACVDYDEVISIAAYNRLYGDFMDE